jgi:NAD(P)H-dependent flavin oxidoreductase YrpB (nitropropane dioxygenase family)
MEEIEENKNFDEQVVEIISHVKQYEEKYEREIPVVFGGGVFDRKDIDHYLSLGCAGVQMATRFVATEECDASDAFKQAYLSASKEDVAIVKSPVGMPGRAIKNAFVKMVEGGRKPVEKCFRCMDHCDPKTTPYCITTALSNSAAGKVDEGLIFCGENAYRINEITTVKKIINELSTS